MSKYVGVEQVSYFAEEYGEELAVTIIEELLDESYTENVELIENGINQNNFENIQRGVHSLKTNFKYLVDKNNPAIDFIQDFELRAKDKEKGVTVQDVDFTPDFIKLKGIFVEFLDEAKKAHKEFQNR